MVNWFSPRHLLVALTIAALHQLTTTQFPPSTAPQNPFPFPPTTQPPLPQSRTTAPPPLSTAPPPLLRRTAPTLPPHHPKSRSPAPAPLPKSTPTTPPQRPTAPPPSPPWNHRGNQEPPSSAPAVQPSKTEYRPRTHPPSPTPAAAAAEDDPQEQLVRKVIEALNHAGNFQGWATLLSAMNLSRLPFDATLFIPADEALSHIPAAVPGGFISFDPFIVPYHVVPVRLCFADLLQLELNSQLPTLLPSNFIVITNNSRSNFTVDGAKITNPDVYKSSTLCVHGIRTILDYSVFGGEGLYSVSAPAMWVPPIQTPAKPISSDPPLVPAREDRVSSPACLFRGFPAIHVAAFFVGIGVIELGLQ